MKYGDDIYIYEWANYFDNNCNSYYIGGGVKALIDPGLTRYLPDLLNRMDNDGIKKNDIRYVINTHSHPDHFQGSELFDPGEVGIAMQAQAIGERPFLLADARRFSFSEVNRRVNELAAGLARTRTVDEIYSAMDSRLGVLETTMRGVPERHRTLFKTIDYSFHLLPPEEQTMFRRLSVFAGGWTPDAAIIEGRAVALREIVYDRDETDGETAPRARRVSK